MSVNPSIQDQQTVSRGAVAVIGAGVIGQSWVTLFAAHGFSVAVQDPRPDLAEVLDAALAEWLPQVPGLVDDPARARARVQVAATVEEAVTGVRAVQEAGPETVDFKRDLWARVEAATPAEALLLSSSSGIVASDQAAAMTDPSRLVIGHPFNPPHVLPLIEVSAASGTPQQRIDRALAFYREVGKHPVQLHRESAGFVANRLQMALVMEAIRLVRAGVVDVRDLDDIVTHSLGIRWAAVGPLLAFHLGGGPGGLGHLLEHIGKGLAADIGQQLSDEDITAVGRAAAEAYPYDRFPAYRETRDALQSAIIAEREAHPLPS
ncbi:3-hydroxyacyl-CoA dehydrogenase NAD-binding domain-containing protein [Raineyella sp. W15-4]|uniref:3-hydroxyacyl-CoA dehydrogenase NAD-binding domain-containing protein n=1 Tax=Raineyella sp. W15-4 TaxID=3081651 RepID=UPI002954957A|nr:3-hydroxyacyl-CoA dehydrogenase NAD-binding domain-containing protein [Raineyella sp. W15-4]WOQ17333.1 3-hydroxyacyl-CoA dehydrogenase NAD-binding domain-containing protein [Raineyella sp. W15-4]